ncbi:MAG: HAD family hydrolase [Candidatus Hodarchaeales archaeon]|jgi:HAD superfamily hydrolase (TIGR01662 family)
MYKAILFDMDGTLTDTMRLQPYLIHKYLLSGSNEILFAEVQRKMAAIYYHNKFTWFKPKTPIYYSKIFNISIFKMLLYSPIMGFQYWRALHQERIFPSTQQVITNLRKAGLKVGLVTNGTNFEVNLKIPSIINEFDFQVTASDVNKKKPDPEMIIKGMKKANLHHPKEILYVGDTLVDMLAARNAGCDFALVTTGTFGPEVVKIGTDKPNNIFSNLKELETFILVKNRI